jgi:hypothetical protein
MQTGFDSGILSKDEKEPADWRSQYRCESRIFSYISSSIKYHHDRIQDISRVLNPFYFRCIAKMKRRVHVLTSLFQGRFRRAQVHVIKVLHLSLPSVHAREQQAGLILIPSGKVACGVTTRRA